jgi:nucleoside-diphosphate-sugar epimerase
VKFAVSGASGFIGRHVLDKLNRLSIPYVAISHRDTNSAPNWVKVDLHNPPANLFEIIGKPDVLIHLAWSGLPNYRALHHFESELPAQYKFLRQLIGAGLPALVVAGTCFEYGMQTGSLREDLKTQPSNSYGFAKDVLRSQLELLQGSIPFSLTWARLFYLYGNGQPASSIWPQLKAAVKQEQPSFAMSGGEQIRDYMPIEKVAGILVNLSGKKKNPGIINVCSGEPISIRRLVETWIKENNWQIKLDLGHYPYPDYEPMAFWGDNTKLLKILKENDESSD